MGEDHRAHRSRGESGRRRSRRPRLGLRRRDDAARDGRRLQAAEVDRRAAEEGLLGSGHRENSWRKYSAGDGGCRETEKSKLKSQKSKPKRTKTVEPLTRR